MLSTFICLTGYCLFNGGISFYHHQSGHTYYDIKISREFVLTDDELPFATVPIFRESLVGTTLDCFGYELKGNVLKCEYYQRDTSAIVKPPQEIAVSETINPIGLMASKEYIPVFDSRSGQALGRLKE